MSIRRRAAALAALALPALLLSAGAASAVELESRTEHAPALDLEIENIEPMILTDGDTATITASLVNNTDATLDAAVTLNAQGWTPNSRSSLLLWLEPGRYDPAYILGREEVEELRPGQRETVTFEVPTSGFFFDAWGPRGIELLATHEGETVDRERSYVLWWNNPGVEPTGVGVIAPVAHTAAELRTLSADRLADLLALDGTPGLTLAVDPSIPHGVLLNAVALPWFNADPEALLTADPDRYDLAVSQSALGGARVLTWLTQPSWEVLETEASLGDVLLVPSSTVTGLEELTYTPNALVSSEEIDTVMLDDDLTSILAGYLLYNENLYALNEIEQQQLLAALTSVITRERPFDSRTVLAGLGWEITAEAAARAEIFGEFPWVETRSLNDVLALEPTNLTLSFPDDAVLPRGGITAQELDEVDALRDSIADARTLSAEIAEKLDEGERDLAHIVARGLRSAPDARTRQIDSVTWTTDHYLGGVSVIGPAGPINMISSESEFPVNVENTLPYAVDVTVTLTPDDPRMQITAPAEAHIAAGATARVAVPVHGVGWGDFEVSATVLTPSGREISEPFIIDVRLRANWEDAGLIAVVSIAVGTLALGIVRTVRRNRRTKRKATIEAAAAQLDWLDDDEPPRAR